MKLYIVFEIKLWPFYFDNGFELLGTVSLTRNLDLDTNSSSKSGNLFDVRGNFSLPNDGFGKNAIIVGADISSSANVDGKIIYISYSKRSNPRVRWYYIDSLLQSHSCGWIFY